MSDELREMSDEELLELFRRTSSDQDTACEQSTAAFERWIIRRDQQKDELLDRLARGRKAEEALAELRRIATANCSSGEDARFWYHLTSVLAEVTGTLGAGEEG